MVVCGLTPPPPSLCVPKISQEMKMVMVVILYIRETNDKLFIKGLLYALRLSLFFSAFFYLKMFFLSSTPIIF